MELAQKLGVYAVYNTYLAPFRRSDRFYVPLFNPNFEGVPVAPDRPCWASARGYRAEALSYSAVKLFSKNSNLCGADT